MYVGTNHQTKFISGKYVIYEPMTKQSVCSLACLLTVLHTSLPKYHETWYKPKN